MPDGQDDTGSDGGGGLGEPEPDAPAVAYLAALVLYVTLGVFLKSIVLNWIVGPTFLLLVLYLLPRALRRSKART